MQPSEKPSSQPTDSPSGQPSGQPTSFPSNFPSGQPSGQPTGQPSCQPSAQPTGQPTLQPSGQPTCAPSSSPTYIQEDWGQVVWDRKRRIRKPMCNNQCSGHGTCNLKTNRCQCFDSWTGIDCSDRACPKDIAWIGHVVQENDVHPILECSNRGTCNRQTGECDCFPGYDGIACQRYICPDDCNYRGVCFPEKFLARNAGVIYETPWDAMKSVGCVCDIGYRGTTCADRECSTGPDPLGGFGNEAGRDCSGRGLCDYQTGLCQCFGRFYGNRCQHNRLLM
jgi:hypothetical protein